MLTIEQQQDWRQVLQVGVLPFATTEGLASLAVALREGDPRLVRRATVEPLYVYPWLPCASACLLAWLGWRGEPDRTVGEVLAAHDVLLACCAVECGSKLAAQSIVDAWDGWGGREYDAEPIAAAEVLVCVEAELARRAGGAA